MPRRVVPAVLSVVVAGLLPAPASAAEPPTGVPCGYAATADPRPDDADRDVAVVRGGPVAAPGGEPVTVRCSITPGWYVRHSDLPAASATSAATPGVGVLPPTVLTYAAAADGEPAQLCTAATVGTTTWYWTDAGWTTTAATACSTSRTVGDLVDCFWWWGVTCLVQWDSLLCFTGENQPPHVPGVLEFRDDGDIYLAGEFFWDCPPYEPWDAA